MKEQQCDLSGCAAGKGEGGSDKKGEGAKGGDKGGKGEATEGGKSDAPHAGQKQSDKHDIKGAQPFALAVC